MPKNYQLSIYQPAKMYIRYLLIHLHVSSNIYVHKARHEIPYPLYDNVSMDPLNHLSGFL